jgi:hypothetical protein
MKIRLVSSFGLLYPDPLPRTLKFVWEGEVRLPPGDPDADTINEYLFEKFNRDDRPNRGCMPSMSAGDLIVWLPRSEQDTTRPRVFMVEGLGFREVIPGLGSVGAGVRAEQQLR